MNKIIVIGIFSIIACTSTAISPKNESGLFLKVINRGTYGISHCDSSTYILIDIRLVNKTDSVYEFISNSCSIIASVLTDSEQVTFCPILCSANSPTLIKINAGQDFTFPIVLKIDTKESEIKNPIKFGMVLFPPMIHDPGRFNGMLKEMKESKENIVWSDPITLWMFCDEPYEIR